MLQLKVLNMTNIRNGIVDNEEINKTHIYVF